MQKEGFYSMKSDLNEKIGESRCFSIQTGGWFNRAAPTSIDVRTGELLLKWNRVGK